MKTKGNSQFFFAIEYLIEVINDVEIVCTHLITLQRFLNQGLIMQVPGCGHGHPKDQSEIFC
jgi:hypothetical protein